MTALLLALAMAAEPAPQTTTVRGEPHYRLEGNMTGCLCPVRLGLDCCRRLCSDQKHPKTSCALPQS